jgi:hypothetical protein
MAQSFVSCVACGGLSPAVARACVHCDAPIAARRARFASLWRLVAGGGFMMTLAACYGVAYRDHRTSYAPDADGDGSPAPTDCNDMDPMAFPGGQDLDGDGVDSNCDGVDGWRDPAVIAAPADPASAAAPAP